MLKGPLFFRDVEGYYLNLAHVLCALPCKQRGPGGAAVVAVQMNTRDIIHASILDKGVSVWRRTHFVVLQMEWDRVLAAARGEVA